VFQVALEDIIAHPIDLESLLGQYDSQTIFVGPLLISSESFPYRCFYIAGASSKIYQSINLGLIDSETKAQCRRAAVVEKLENRFTGVLTFGSHREMAYAVHARWPNEETAEILASAALAMTAELTKAAYQRENIDDGRCAGSLPHSEQSVDLASHGLVDDAGDLDAISTDMAPWALGSLSSNGPVKQQQSKFNEDLAPAVLRLRQSTQLEIVPSLPLEATRRLPSILRYCVVAVAVVVVSAAIGFRTILQVADETPRRSAAGCVCSVTVSVRPERGAVGLGQPRQRYITNHGRRATIRPKSARRSRQAGVVSWASASGSASFLGLAAIASGNRPNWTYTNLRAHIAVGRCRQAPRGFLALDLNQLEPKLVASRDLRGTVGSATVPARGPYRATFAAIAVITSE
jgi:hypothetical protein